MNDKNDHFFDSLCMEAQCGIINDAKTLMKEARRRKIKRLTFNQALEIIKIQRFDYFRFNFNMAFGKK